VAEAAAGGHASIGLRCPDHPVARALLRAAREHGVRGVAGPSANRFGRVSPTTAQHVADEFGPALAVLDGGPCREGIESTIVDCTGEMPVVLRPGTTPRAQIERALREGAGLGLGVPHAGSARAAGTLASHYCPSAQVHLASGERLAVDVEAALAAEADAEAGRPPEVGVYSRTSLPPRAGLVLRTMPTDPAAVAHELFAVLRLFDAQGVRHIWVEAPPAGMEWDGVRDRLQRAATR
jgi:L-threonylcarbamoyladenylate synthase